MQLINAFVHNPIKVSVGVLLVALFGVVAVVRMPMQLTPEVQTPTITIETRWPGASPQEVEQEIIHEQEEQLKSVEGVTKLSSESMDSMGRITMEFLVGANMDEALLKVNSRLNQVSEYPEDADQPIISTANAADRPIAWFILSAKRPTDERLREFQERYRPTRPEIAAGIANVRAAHNEGLAMMRLRRLAKAHPEVYELLPPASLNVTQLRRLAEDEIESRFERVAGVSQSNVIGGLEDELQVIVDPQKLAARRLTITDVRNVLRGQNQDTSAGDYWEGKRRYVVRTLGQFTKPQDVEQQLLAVQDGAPVYVRDVAQVRLGYKKADGLVRRFGESSIAINAARETGANVLDVMDGLRKTNEELREILEPMGLQLTQVYDETEYIYSAVGLVQENIILGGALTMIVLMAFLHLGMRALIVSPLIIGTALAAVYVSTWFFVLTLAIIIGAGFWFARGALVVGLAIPTSIIGTFLVLSMLGRSLNVISLAGLAFAVGMLVDNAIVVLENVYRRFDELGEKPFTAAVRGTQEVWGAIVASTLTTVAVFLPIVFVQEEAGQLFRDIALAIATAVGLSMVVSMIVIPPAAARLFGRREDTPSLAGSAASQLREDAEHSSRLAGNNGDRTWEGNGDAASSPPAQPVRRRWQAAFHGVSRGFIGSIEKLGELFVTTVVGMNKFVQGGVVRGLLLVGVMVFGSFSLSYLFWPKVEYLPTGNRNLVFGILLPPPGYNLDKLMELGEKVESDLRPYWDVDPNSPEAQQLDYPVIGDFFFVARGRQVFMGIRAHDPGRVGELAPLVQRVGSQLPGTFAVAKQSSLFEQGLTGGRTIEIEIVGPELTKLVELGGQVMGQVQSALPGTPENPTQVRPVPSLDLNSPELHIKPKWMQATQMGVNSTDLGYSANALVDGAYAGDYFLGGDKIDLTIIGAPRSADPNAEHRGRSQDIRALPIATPIGELVPLEAVAEVILSSGPEQVNHRERVRAITVEVSPPPDVALEDAMERIQSQIVDPLRASGQLAGGYRINLAGTADKLATMQATFVGNWTGWNSQSVISVFTSQFVLVILITYLLMAALFESWLYPFVIILSVPLGAVGGILGLNGLNAYLGVMGEIPQQLDILTMLGFVILIGTVVNNPILIVHQALNHMREDGMGVRDAVLESVRTRIRPIFMTTTTTVLGLLPLVLFPGAGSELYRGLGAVVLGGLVISTIFTLVLVPTLFTLTLEAKVFLYRLFLDRATREAHALEIDQEPASVA